MMPVSKTSLDGVLLIEPRVFGDDREEIENEIEDIRADLQEALCDCLWDAITEGIQACCIEHCPGLWEQVSAEFAQIWITSGC